MEILSKVFPSEAMGFSWPVTRVYVRADWLKKVGDLKCTCLIMQKWYKLTVIHDV